MKQTKTTKAFSDQLSDLITDSKKDLRTIASECGVKASSISNYQNDGAECGINNLAKLAEYFGVSTDWLLGRAKEKTVNPDIQAAVRYTGLSEETIKSLRKANKQFELLNKSSFPDSDSYHFKNNPADLFFSSPNFRKAIFAFHKYGTSSLLHEHTHTQFIEVLQGMGLIPKEKITITPEEIFDIASKQENDRTMQSIFGLGTTLLTIQQQAQFCRFCLIEELEKIADSYKEVIVKEANNHAVNSEDDK